MSAWEWVLVGLAGAVGAPIRYVVDNVVTDRFEGVFPYGTLVINVTGCFLLGVLTGLALYHGLSTSTKEVLGTGLLGAYTTFSTFGFETLQLVDEGRLGAASLNVVASVAVGAFAGGAGLALAGL